MKQPPNHFTGPLLLGSHNSTPPLKETKAQTQACHHQGLSHLLVTSVRSCLQLLRELPLYLGIESHGTIPTRLATSSSRIYDPFPSGPDRSSRV